MGKDWDHVVYDSAKRRLSMTIKYPLKYEVMKTFYWGV